jgi:hypothetical protein
MNEPRKPIFSFLWPAPDPKAPVDGAYRQVRRVRVTGRGPIRIAALVVGTLVLISTTGSLILAAVTTSWSPEIVLGSAVSATALAVILRGWVVGTYVNDEGISIETTLRRTGLPWSQVRGVSTTEQRSPFLGLPLRVRCARSVVETTEGQRLATHVYATSPDLWLRPEAFDMARIRLEQWAEPR